MGLGGWMSTCLREGSLVYLGATINTLDDALS